MDSSPVLIAGLLPFLTMALARRRSRWFWPLLGVSFPLCGLVIVAAADEPPGGADGLVVFAVLAALVFALCGYGWVQWATPQPPVRTSRAAAATAAAIGLGSALAGAIVARLTDMPIVASVLGFGVVGVWLAALVLIAASDPRGWDFALVAFVLASGIVIPQAATTFERWQPGLVALDLVVVAIGLTILVLGRRSWRGADPAAHQPLTPVGTLSADEDAAEVRRGHGRGPRRDDDPDRIGRHAQVEDET